MTVQIESVGVVGAGVMGAGIAQALAQARLQVMLYDASPRALEDGEERIQKGLSRLERPELFSLVRKAGSFARLADCDAVIEAVGQDLAVKREILTQLDRLIEPPKLLASNSSWLPISRLAVAVENPDRVVGMNFFRPAQIMRLVEVARAEHTREEAVRRAVALTRRLDKTPVVCRDSPGFVANRVVRPFFLAAMRLLEQGAGTPADIDRAIRDAGLRFGPFEMIDMMGLEASPAMARGLWEALGKPARLEPLGIEDALLKRGCRGRKNACGFYVYGENPPGTFNPDLEELVPRFAKHPRSPSDVVREVSSAVVEEAALVAEEGVASREDIDTAMRLGFGWPRGPFQWEKDLAV